MGRAWVFHGRHDLRVEERPPPQVRDGDAVSRKGKILILATHDGKIPVDLRMVQVKEIGLVGSLAYVDEFEQAIEVVARGKADLEKLITHRFPLEELTEAFKVQADANKAVKVVVEANE